MSKVDAQGWRNFYDYLLLTSSDIEGVPLNLGLGNGPPPWIHSTKQVNQWLKRAYADFEREGFPEEWAKDDDEA
jgi:hypothetical protein